MTAESDYNSNKSTEYLTKVSAALSGRVTAVFARTYMTFLVMAMVVAVLGCLNVYAEDDTAAASGEYTDGSVTYTWELAKDENGETTSTAAITGFSCEDDRYELNFPSEIEGYQVTSIPWMEYSFMYNDQVTGISIPDGITDVPWYAMKSVPNLETITVSDNNTGLSVHDGILFNKDMTMLMEYPASKQGSEYVIPESVSSLRDYAFSNTKYLEELTLSSQITWYENSINYCDSIRTLNLNMLSYVGGTQLNGNVNVEKITVSENNTALCVYDNVLYGNNDDNTTKLLYYPSGRTDEVFTIPDEVNGMTVTYIMDGAFNFCKLREIIFPESLVMVGGRAFEYSQNLTTAVFPENTANLGSNAFMGCNSMKYIYVPEAAASIACFTSGGPEDIKIYGVPGSAAEEYVNEGYNGCFFVNIAEEKIPQDITLNNEETAASCSQLEDGSWQINADLAETKAVDLSAFARKGVTYSCENTDIATVDENGSVTLLSEGTAQVRITANVAEGDEEYFAPTEMIINIVITNSDDPGTDPDDPGTDPVDPVCTEQTITGSSKFTKTYGCSAFSLKQSAMTDLTYKSSNTRIAKVSSTGKVTIKRPGTVRITVTAAGTDAFYEASKTVTVKSTVGRPTLKVKAGKRKIKLSWNKVPKASGYIIYVKYPGSTKYKRMLKVSSKIKSVTHMDLTSGKTYRYKVRAYVKINGKTYYSKVSKMKKIKAK